MEISLEKLRELSVKVEEWACRYDIEKVHKFIEENPAHFQSNKKHNEAYCLSGFIIICLLARLNEISDSEEFN